MKVCYLDASAWVKRYLEEPGSKRVDEFFREDMALASASLGHVETAAALARQRTARKLDQGKLNRLEAQLDEEWEDFLQLDVTKSVTARAVEFARRWGLRGADAIHLAAAWDLKERLEPMGTELLFVSSDLELLHSAEAAGMAVENPANGS